MQTALSPSAQVTEHPLQVPDAALLHELAGPFASEPFREPSPVEGAFAPLVASDIAGGAVPLGCASASDAADRSSRTVPKINSFISTLPSVADRLPRW